MSPAAARPVTCQERCTALSSCVYLQYKRGICWLCINDAADVTTEDGLASAATQTYRAHIKIRIEDVIFASAGSATCRGRLMMGVSRGPAENFEQTTAQNNLNRMRFCSANWGDFRDKVSGFWMYFGAAEQSLVGCRISPSEQITGVMPDFVRAQNEFVLAVEACFQYVNGYNVLNTMTLVTNRRQFGPVGVDQGGCVTYRNVGYDLTGFYGSAATGIDSIGAIFSRC